MTQAKTDISSQTDFDKALVLLISDSINEIVEDLNDFLISKDLDTIFFSLDDDLGKKYKILEEKNRLPYKIIFVYGFDQISQVKYQKALDFFDGLKDSEIAIISLLSVSKHLKILDNFNPEYDTYLQSKEIFLKKFTESQPESLIFLAEDLLFKQEKILYPFKVF